MKFMKLYRDVPEALEELQDMVGKNIMGATAKRICRIPVLYDDDDSFAYNALGLCFEGSYLSYLRHKYSAKKDNQWFEKGWI